MRSLLVSVIAIFVLYRDVEFQLTLCNSIALDAINKGVWALEHGSIEILQFSSVGASEHRLAFIMAVKQLLLFVLYIV